MSDTLMADEPVKRGPGRPPNSSKMVDRPTVNITYRPMEGDPSHVVWNRHRFHANVPKPVKDPEMIASAKANPWFEVDGHERAQVAAVPTDPKTPEQYRLYAVDWINKAQSAAELRQLWREDAGLREKCGVGTDDIEYLMNQYNPKLAELSKAEAA